MTFAVLRLRAANEHRTGNPQRTCDAIVEKTEGSDVGVV